MNKIIAILVIVVFPIGSSALAEIPFPLRGQNGELILGLGNLANYNYSPDGKYMATTGTNSIFLWDANTGDLLRSLGSSQYGTMVFTPDSAKLLILNGNKVTLWDVQTGDRLLEFDINSPSVIALVISPDSRYAFFGNYDANIVVEKWDIAKGAFVGTIASRAGILTSLVLSGDGKLLAVGSGDGYVRLWNTSVGEMANEFSLEANVELVILSPDSRFLIAKTSNGQWYLLDVSTEETIHHPFDTTNPVLGFSPDSRKILYRDKGTLSYFDIYDGTTTAISGAPSKQDHVNVKLTPDGKNLLLYDEYTCHLDVWSLETAKYRCSIRGQDSVYACGFSPDETKVFAVGDRAGTFYEYDVASGRLTRSINCRRVDLVGAVGLSRDGQYMALSDTAGNWIKVWDTATGNEIQSLSGAEIVGSIDFSSDNKCILSGGGQINTWAALWDMATVEKKTSFVEQSLTAKTVRNAVSDTPVSPQCYSWDLHGPIAVFSPDESRLATVSGSQTGFTMDLRSGDGIHQFVRIWDTTTGELIRSFPAHTAIISSVAFSRDGQWIVTGSKDRERTVKLWNAATGEERMVFSPLSDSIIATAISPDNRYVFASCSAIFPSDFDYRTYPWVYDYFDMNFHPSVVIWNAETGELSGLLSGHTAPVTSIHFSSDGKRILTGSADGTMRIWNIDDVIHSSGVEDYRLYQ